MDGLRSVRTVSVFKNGEVASLQKDQEHFCEQLFKMLEEKRVGEVCLGAEFVSIKLLHQTAWFRFSGGKLVEVTEAELKNDTSLLADVVDTLRRLGFTVY